MLPRVNNKNNKNTYNCIQIHDNKIGLMIGYKLL